MNEDYLWDKSGRPDPEIVRLEEALGTLRWRTPGRARPRPWKGLAIAAALLLAFGTALYLRRTQALGPATAWELSLAGGKPNALRGGELIETGEGTRGRMKSEFVGEVNIEPNSRLRLIAAHASLQQFALEHGTIHAFIWAPPATFVVDTPAAKTVDLGCRYTLRVTKDGTGFLTVETGWVAFEWQGVESFIPAGAVCRTRRGHGPDTPYFRDAPQALSNRVAEFDQNGDPMALKVVLAAARPRDALTLWHLLRRTQGTERAAVFERFRALVNLPENVTPAAIQRGDKAATDAAWDSLALGDMTWWRGWKRDW